MTAPHLRTRLRELADPAQAENLQRFFKTGPGQYGEGDIFIGVKVPQIRKVAREGRALGLPGVESLLHSGIHEERLLALLILVIQFEKADRTQRKAIYDFYMANTTRVNNWDLVDLSAHHIVGAFLADRSRTVLQRLARSRDLWTRRIAIIATFYFIRRNEFDDTLAVADLLLTDDHDLIHKAVGWMLREVGKRDLAVEEDFLKPRYSRMPRTMLRYAIERFPEPKRQRYLKGTI